jgi:phosphatidylserine/phosphatidylglycerophosphate/cardiolipin synthase-like enzyme
METSTVFENIAEAIIQQIKHAEHAIRICVPWLTDDDILRELVEKTKQKVFVELLIFNDEFNKTKTSFFNQLIARDSKVYLVDRTPDGGMLHHKFCTIDREILITGSYNWSNNAKKNDENILISVAVDDDDYLLIMDYDDQFQKLLYKYGIENEDEGWDKAEAYVSESIRKQEDAKFYYDLASDYLRNKKYDEALESINEGIQKLPYPDKYFYLLKHIILRVSGDFLESTEYLYRYLSQIAGNDNDSIDSFNKIHQIFIKTIIVNGSETYKVIDSINQKTRANLGHFAAYKIEPHFFKYEELDTLPF